MTVDEHGACAILEPSETDEATTPGRHGIAAAKGDCGFRQKTLFDLVLQLLSRRTTRLRHCTTKMDPNTFQQLLLKYPKVRDGRAYVASNSSVCRLAEYREPLPEPRASAGAAKAALVAPESPNAPITPVVSEFWGGLNALVKDLAAERAAAQAPAGAARLKAQMLMEKKALAAFEDLHFSLLRQSNYEDMEGVLALAAAALEQAQAQAAQSAGDDDDGFATPRSGSPTQIDSAEAAR